MSNKVIKRKARGVLAEIIKNTSKESLERTYEKMKEEIFLDTLSKLLKAYSKS